MVRLSQVAEFRSCLTCMYRRQYPPSLRKGGPVFFQFYCDLAADSGKSIVKPEDACDYWKGVALGLE